MKDEIFWGAVIANDRRFDGTFVYAVRSTGIFCRPSCTSRRPRRENVEFFTDVAAAGGSGYRPCRRCRPGSAEAAPRIAGVISAAERLAGDDPPTLADLAEAADLSPAHFQRLFKDLIGVSPKKFADAKRIERFRRAVGDGCAVADAMYGAGFGSSRGLYEKAAERLGMTPGAYARKGKNMKIEYTITDCDLGRLLVARTAKGVCAVNFGDSDEELEAGLRREYAAAEIERNPANLDRCVEAIIANLGGAERTLDLPLDLRATAFQMRVWEELRKIPYGEIVSYQTVAKNIGKPAAVRAVAAACAANRVALVIPCHRVVRGNGDVSGYRWGVERKRVILKNEKERL